MELGPRVEQGAWLSLAPGAEAGHPGHTPGCRREGGHQFQAGRSTWQLVRDTVLTPATPAAPQGETEWAKTLVGVGSVPETPACRGRATLGLPPAATRCHPLASFCQEPKGARWTCPARCRPLARAMTSDTGEPGRTREIHLEPVYTLSRALKPRKPQGPQEWAARSATSEQQEAQGPRGSLRGAEGLGSARAGPPSQAPWAVG